MTCKDQLPFQPFITYALVEGSRHDGLVWATLFHGLSENKISVKCVKGHLRYATNEDVSSDIVQSDALYYVSHALNVVRDEMGEASIPVSMNVWPAFG